MSLKAFGYDGTVVVHLYRIVYNGQTVGVCSSSWNQLPTRRKIRFMDLEHRACVRKLPNSLWGRPYEDDMVLLAPTDEYDYSDHIKGRR